MDKLVSRFINYARIESTSDPLSDKTPSSDCQWEMVKYLEKELKDIGLSDIELDEKGYLMATLNGNRKDTNITIGFIAHYDTSPDFNGKNVNPIIHENYNGEDIILNKEKNIILSPTVYPELTKYKGQTIITTDGNTLLGADDKAGIAAIITALEELIIDKNSKHCRIRVCFTPDEEIGRGANFFDVKKFGADYAYTIDGDELGSIEYESFNAAEAKIKIKGNNIHPGYAKNKMINAIHIASEFNSLLPVFERPEYTEKYEGFYHLMKFTGSVEEVDMYYIIRDHDKEIFNKRKEYIKNCADFINKKYNKELIYIELKDQYYNMRYPIEENFKVVELALKAMQELNIKPIIKPIRGGTDGSRLSYMGLPCPNIFTGGHNFHSKYEYISVETMHKCKDVIKKIVEIAE